MSDLYFLAISSSLIILGSWLTARWLSTSQARSLAVFKKKSTWKLAEIPWLALAGFSIVMAQQSILVREHEDRRGVIRATYSIVRRTFEMAADQFYTEISNPQCKENKAIYIPRKLNEPFNFCAWLAEARSAVRVTEQIFQLNWTTVDSSETATILLEIALQHPHSRYRERATEKAHKAREQMLTGTSTEQWDNIRGSMCRPAHNAADVENPLDTFVPITFRYACIAGHTALAYIGDTAARSKAVIIDAWALRLWPLVLAFGLGFRIARTVAEYHLDRASESLAEKRDPNPNPIVQVSEPTPAAGASTIPSPPIPQQTKG